MASLCTKCLAELQSGSQICSQCGTEQVAVGMGTSTAPGAGPGTLNGIGDATNPGAGTTSGSGNGNVAGNGTGLPAGVSLPTGAAPTTPIRASVGSPLPGAVAPQTVLPPVVPPIPGKDGLGSDDAAAATAKSNENGSDALALKWEPPPFERTIDPASPQSLLGASAHRAPGSKVASRPVNPAVNPASAVIPTVAPPVVPPPDTAPTPQEMLFGAPQLAHEQPAAVHSPQTGAAGVAGAHTDTSLFGAPLFGAPRVDAPQDGDAPGHDSNRSAHSEVAKAGATHRSRVRDGVLRKLLKPKALIPIAIIVVAGAMVASVMATAGSSTPKTATSKTNTGSGKSGQPVKTKALSHGTAPGKTVTIALRSPGNDPRPDITISVGNDRPIHVVLDTGSVGLRVFGSLVPTGVGRGIHVTNQPDSIEYVDGTQLSGPVSDAVIHIGKLTTATPVPFQLVQSVTCDPLNPDCPASGGAPELESIGVDGIMGIGMSGSYPNDPTTNPLLSLAAPYRNSWSIAMQGGGRTLPAPGTLILGAQNPTTPTAEFGLQQQGASSHGLPTWNDQFNLCWTVGGISSCELSVFDSGSDLTILGGTGFANVSTDAPGEIANLSTGTSVQASQEVESSTLWSFSAGGGAMQTVLVEPSGADWVNSGVQAFYSFTVTYNELSGSIFLS